MPIHAVEDAKRHKIFVQTTRQRSEQPEVFFSKERSFEIGLASVTVSVPPAHEPGKIELARSGLPDPRRHFVATDPVSFSRDHDFVQAIDAELATRAPNERDVLFFIHGYNNTLSDAVLRVAQFVADSGFQGVAVLFSWASGGGGAALRL